MCDTFIIETPKYLNMQ